MSDYQNQANANISQKYTQYIDQQGQSQTPFNQGNKLAGQDAPQTPMANIAHRIASAVDEAARLADRLSVLECRVTGGGNPIGKDHPTPPRPIPVGHIGQMGSSLDDLADRMNRAAESISRLLDAV